MSGIQAPEREMGNERRSPKECTPKLTFGGWALFTALDSMVPNQRGDQRQPVGGRDFSTKKGGVGATMRTFFTPSEKSMSTLRSSSVGVDTLRLNEERRLP